MLPARAIQDRVRAGNHARWSDLPGWLAASDGALPFLLRYRLTGGVHSPWDPAMIDFALARRMMVDGQVRTSDVTDLRIIAAMLELPRERFVSAADTDLAYLDTDVPAAAAATEDAHRRSRCCAAASVAGGALSADSCQLPTHGFRVADLKACPISAREYADVEYSMSA